MKGIFEASKIVRAVYAVKVSEVMEAVDVAKVLQYTRLSINLWLVLIFSFVFRKLKMI